jgi:hypothetical protein
LVWRRSAELADDARQKRLQVEEIAGDGRSESLKEIAVGPEKEDERENEREVTGTLNEEVFAEEDVDVEDLSLSLIAFAEKGTKEARIRNGRTRKGPLEEPRGEESGAV